MTTIALPVCRWRRQPTGPGFHVCISSRVPCNSDGIPDAQCGTCRHRDHEPNQGPRRPCRHFGKLLRVAPVKLTNRTDRACVTAPIHACAVHRECTPITGNTRLANCLTCKEHHPDWVRPAAGSVRHLTYYLWPVGPLWRWNVDQLRARLSLFNGRRLVTIAEGGGGASYDEAVAAFCGASAEFVRVANDPGRREMMGHMPMIEKLSAYRGAGDCTFYAHGKGASSHLYGDGVRRWAQAMYELLLDYWPAVRRSLVDHAAVGVFRRLLTPVPGVRSSWHYSGSFRWLRNRDLYSRNWQIEDQMWMGSEMYPGRHFTLDESACLAGEFAYAGAGLYIVPTWELWAQAAVDDFTAAHSADRETAMLVTIILTAHAQPQRVHEAIASVQAQNCDAWQLIVMYSDRIDAQDLVGRYITDARIRLEPTGESAEGSPTRCGQGWAINEAVRRRLVRGDLILCLSDDDVLDSGAVAGWIQAAAARPDQNAWYGCADRVRLHESGSIEELGPLGDRGTGGPTNWLLSHVDGLQVCVRHTAWQMWPEELDASPAADGHWLNRLASVGYVYHVPLKVGTHRHTPQSTFTH